MAGLKCIPIQFLPMYLKFQWWTEGNLRCHYQFSIRQSLDPGNFWKKYIIFKSVLPTSSVEIIEIFCHSTMLQNLSKCEVKVHNTRIYLPLNFAWIQGGKILISKIAICTISETLKIEFFCKFGSWGMAQIY